MRSIGEDVYAFSARTIDGEQQRLDVYRGSVLLVVNVASRCGYTPQYADLERLYRRHRDAGLVVLGFPCDQFGRQEPGADSEIFAFCRDTYSVTFPLFSKIDVKGPHAHPLFRFLSSAKKGLLGTAAVKWNFTKFLVDRRGQVTRRYGPATAPGAIERDVILALSGADA